MSEKRFKLNDKGSFILEDGEPLKPLGKVVDLLNEQQSRIEMLEKAILDCLFENESIGIVAEELGLVEDD